jgi:CPA2 family monovalent cation:H+ antiporter-2
MRDAFAVLFFVSVGMLLDPGQLLRTPVLIALATTVIIVGKPLAALAIAWFAGQPWRTGFAVAASLAQIGEFSFIVGTLGNQLNVLPVEATQTLVAASIVSITLAPLLYRAADRIGARIDRSTRRGTAGQPASATGASRTDRRREAIVIGYGPVGRTAVRLLRENGLEPTVVEMNIDTFRELRDSGIEAVHGDATKPETMAAAGAAGARSVIVSVAGMPGIEETIRLAREANAEARVLVRANSLREAAAVRAAGADETFSGEREVALAFTEAILRELGATPEQIERERDRVHGEIPHP